MRFFALLVALLCWPLAAHGAVTIHFYSRDLGVRYPHAFFTLTGTVDATGEVVNANYGFTAKSTGLMTALTWVGGKVKPVDQAFIDRSIEHFAITLSDEDYRKVLARVEDWGDGPQPSYNLNRANCVFFVADIARAVGLRAEPINGLMLKPKTFLERVKTDNDAFLTDRAAALLAAQTPTPLVQARQ